MKARLRERQARVGDLLLEGRSADYIARSIGASVATVKRDAAVCEQEWIDRQAVGHQAKVARQLARLDYLEQEYRLAWEKSKGAWERKIAKRVKADGVDGAAREEQQVIREDRVGDAAFLDGLRWVCAERAKVEGTYAPTRSVEELYLGVDAVFTSDTVAEEMERTRQWLKDARFIPAGLLNPPASMGNGDAGNGHDQPPGEEEGNGEGH